MLFPTIQHLLPRALAWRVKDTANGWTIGDGSEIGEPGLFIGGTDDGPFLSRFLRGIANALDPIRDYFDLILLDVFPDTTRELAAWEAQFGIESNPDDDIRRLNLDAEWSATGGQSPAYINSILAAAGFDVFVHEWWSSGPPYVARDPHDYTVQPLVGSVQCSDFPDQPQCSAFADQPQCNAFLANDPHYIVNRNLTDVAPPPVPSDPNTWPYFVYFGAATFPDIATVPAERRNELERLMEKLTPSQHWIVTLIDYV